jgi:putative DNA methylase
MTRTFIETQFPIARLSAESYKERKANNGQTLTRLGKWWGRKPLVLVRASILGMLMPASNDPKRDREIFLKILTMDDDGVWDRCIGDIPVADWVDAAPMGIRDEYFGARGFVRGLSDEDKEDVKQRIWDALSDEERAELDAKKRRPIPDREEFDALPYAERTRYCYRPENVQGPLPAAWAEINIHLGTTAANLAELIDQLGHKRFGRRPRVGDSFCGGGSIPFEAARIGCDAYGWDLNPVAGLLTWASLNLLAGDRSVQDEVRQLQQQVYTDVDGQIQSWEIEHNDRGERADAYLYCVEVKPQGCEYFIPLAPAWLVGEKSRAVIKWVRVDGSDRLNPEVLTIKESELSRWKGDTKRKIVPMHATVDESRVIDPFDASRTWSVESLRGPQGLRHWTADDVVPRDGDVFQERLYCIRWVKTVWKNGKRKEVRRYAAPEEADLRRETRVLELLKERFARWQLAGIIPSRKMPEDGEKTSEPIRTRGWTHWHHLFTARQLLSHGLLAEAAFKMAVSKEARVGCLLGIGRIANWDSRLCRWRPDPAGEGVLDVFSNQALNPLYNYGNRGFSKLDTAWFLNFVRLHETGSTVIATSDARDIQESSDLWITDPPYADAVNYHELGDYFLAWYDRQIADLFPTWVADSRAELAVRGDGDDFRRSMVEIYRNLARHMPDNGLQMVMFTHQNPAVWADLGMILWAAGLKATAAWTISTETEAAGIKKGNYVQGTVCLVLRKRIGSEPGFLDEIFPMVEDEVHRQIDSMRALDEGGEPNFNDADYQLAAYAAALKVLTQYGNIDGRDVEDEVFAVRTRNEPSDFQRVIERAINIACDYLVPRGLDLVWRDLNLAERYYLRALDIESRGERRKGMYEELARGFNLSDIKPLLLSDKANGARMLTPSGFDSSTLATVGEDQSEGVLPVRRGRAAAGGPHPFASSPLRHLLFAVCETTENDRSPEPGRQYLRDTFGQAYWGMRERFTHLLDWLASLANTEEMDAWADDSESARILAGRLRNDHA